MSVGELRVDAVSLRWTVDATTSMHSTPFQYNGGSWHLVFVLYGSPYINLYKESSVCHRPFRASVVVESVGTGQFVRVLSQVTHLTTGDFPGKGHSKQIWKKENEAILAAVPEFRLYAVLKLLVVLEPAEGTDSSADTDSRATQTESELPEEVEEACSTPSISYQNAAPCLEMLSEDLSRLMVQGSYPDMEFQCAGQTTKGHKSIVCSRSPVMASMLSTDMVEGRTGVVTIPDIEPGIFQKFLKYLYSGRVEDLTFDTALALYGVGDQYGVRGLARRCSDFLMQHLSVENACEVLAVADAHEDSKMIEKVIEYILENKIPLVSDRWSAFCSDHPELAIKVLTHSYKMNVDGN